MSIKTEIIAIGNELISGDVVDINSSYISKQLLSLGVEASFHTNVGDYPKDIKEILESSLSRSDLIFLTGGLGPTDDDMTAEIVADFFNKKLVYNEEIWQNILSTLEKTGRRIDIYNKKQAYIPEGAKYFLNYSGTAPCILIELNEKKIFLLPGVPSEVKYFFKQNIKSFVQNLSKTAIKTKKIKLSGIAEARVNEIIKDIVEKNTTTIAFLPQSSELIVKITAKAENELKASEILKNVEKEIVSRLKDFIFGYDEDSIEIILKDILTDKNKTVAIAESCTGGLVSKLLTDVSGSSGYIGLNIVTYSNQAKNKILNVKNKTLEEFGAVSEETAKEMAEGIKNIAESDFGLAITGIAGPTGGTEEKPVGLIYVAITNGSEEIAQKLNFPTLLPRTEIRMRAAKKALHLLKDFILKTD
jgi:nicotinamide-nucleotide amidase